MHIHVSVQGTDYIHIDHLPKIENTKIMALVSLDGIPWLIQKLSRNFLWYISVYIFSLEGIFD